MRIERRGGRGGAGVVGAGEVGVHEGDCGVGVAGGGQEGEGGRDCGEDRVS